MTGAEMKSKPYMIPLFLTSSSMEHVHNFTEVQQCTLLSIKIGGCSEQIIESFPKSLLIHGLSDGSSLVA
ncbi:unnamed protein product, partial [Brassica oleracea var. botrytis]